jgi:heme oxygenase
LLLRALHAIYSALEAGLDRHPTHPLLQPVRLAGVARRNALATDLAALHGVHWRTELPLVREAARYARRVERLARWQPALLAAHAYVRYLGDLHGGQVLRGLVARRFGLEGEAGTSFYGFGSQADTRALVEAFRQGLAEIGHRAPANVDTLVREAQRAFETHCRLFAEIDGAVLASAALQREPSHETR